MTWEQKFENNPIRTSLWVVTGIFLFLLVLIWSITAVVFGLRVATAGIVGRGEAHIIKESAPNRIIQQAGFEQKFADIQKFDVQVKEAGAAIADWDKANAGKPDNAIGTLAQQRKYLVDVLTGLKQQCQTTVANYNADARKYLAADFRAADLPESISLDKHCKE